MYKVFVNDSVICLSENCDFLTGAQTYPFDESFVIELIENLVRNTEQSHCLVTEDLFSDWNKFRSLLRIEVAAGGKVFNSEGEVLFIKRFGKWDLPKGKVEEGESIEVGAIREVEEECGISKLQIVQKLPTTYHIFRRRGVLILKETFWFEMKTSYTGNLTPQEEEDITEVHFFNAESTAEALQNTYKNIRLLFD